MEKSSDARFIGVNMSAIDTLNKLIETEIYNANLKYCLVNRFKEPYGVNNEKVKVNILSNFVNFEDLLSCKRLNRYMGVGISIQASKICAIDIDKCFREKYNINTISENAKIVLDLFKDIAYCEYSFSGNGLRILFDAALIDEYSLRYYIKNQSYGFEYYQPSNSYRYVTVTGNVIYNNKIRSGKDIDNAVFTFLETYMKRKVIPIKKVITNDNETKTLNELLIDVKRLYFSKNKFQELWFAQAPGSGKNESELDFQLLVELYEQITQDKALLKEIFEASPYYNSKDDKHLYKWEASNNRYFEYIYSNIRRIKS